ncbi:MAG TPA: hypothetical protein DCL80_07445 [Balneola sp.]|jgi:hypothetical protein|nr:hypothetical protein [Bacteroidota bacterium]MAC05512.1 hypothetical protein [Balneola sp.]MAB66570.1 hypothetical protein [Bacteroidota bacterium]MAO77530.1 hypothetical protein [Balneola sp.]MBF66039.1 hypothetical protein [Balneola sp.]|tara:strand:- start:46 stop:444 length:399 start_codon:yes stop_codon:yes gene_type:complete
MNSHTTFLVFGPAATLRRMSDKMFKEHAPKFLYEHSKEEDKDKLFVAVYEEYEKQINSSVTLTCIFESTQDHNKIVLKKTGGRMGFRGSSLSEERNVESNVVDFIIDFGKRFGLTVQEEQVSDTPPEENEED